MISVYCFLAAVLEGSLVAVLAATRDHGPGLICNFFLDCFLGFRNVGDAKKLFYFRSFASSILLATTSLVFFSSTGKLYAL